MNVLKEFPMADKSTKPRSPKPSLTKAEQTQRTRRAILDRARLLFATKGYAATGTEEMIQDLGITRGALYHQFGDKLGVFKAVVAEAYDEMTAHVGAQVEALDDIWEQLRVGCRAFLEVAQREELRRLIFIEAPSVLASDTLVEFDQFGFGLLAEAIALAVKQGELEAIDAEGFAHLVNGALNELAAWIAQSSNSRTAAKRLKTAQALVEALLENHRADE
jgi:AcrR family transcriptional regulator